MITFGQRVKVLRKQNNITQKCLAKKCGVSQSLITQIECGTKDPSFQTIRNMQLSFGISLEKIFKGVL